MERGLSVERGGLTGICCLDMRYSVVCRVKGFTPSRLFPVTKTGDRDRYLKNVYACATAGS